MGHVRCDNTQYSWIVVGTGRLPPSYPDLASLADSRPHTESPTTEASLDKSRKLQRQPKDVRTFIQLVAYVRRFSIGIDPLPRTGQSQVMKSRKRRRAEDEV